jgi:putative chitinase
MITAALLEGAMGAPRDRAELFAPHLDAACRAYEIDTPARLAAFLAQIGHESGGLRHVREVWGPTPAQERYEGRADLGNTQPGDGRRYAGHGLIQTTGRYNHRAVRDRLRQRGIDAPDFEANPDLLADPKWAAWSAADYWDWRGCNALADAGSFDAITVKINGGLNGQADRLERWAKAKAVTAAALNGNAPRPPAPAPRPDNTIAPPNHPAASSEPKMPLPAIAAALLPTLIESIPRLGKLFGSGSAVAERNVAAATMAMEIAKEAVGASNEQEAVQRIAADPAAKQAAQKAVEERWFELSEAGGGGIEGARKADAEMRATGDLLQSASLWVAVPLLGLVYLVVLSLIGLVGTATWSDDVRAGLAGSLISAVIGGLVGYYYGQTTSRNRTPSA